MARPFLATNAKLSYVMIRSSFRISVLGGEGKSGAVTQSFLLAR